jgi:hypothetical protein
LQRSLRAADRLVTKAVLLRLAQSLELGDTVLTSAAKKHRLFSRKIQENAALALIAGAMSQVLSVELEALSHHPRDLVHRYSIKFRLKTKCRDICFPIPTDIFGRSRKRRWFRIDQFNEIQTTHCRGFR